MAPSLTEVQRRVREVADMPADQRRAAAAALIGDLDTVLADDRVAPSWAAQEWTRLARVGTGQPVRGVDDPREARARAVAALNGGDPVADVRAARDADRAATARAEQARAALAAAVARAHGAGVPVALLAREAGVTRQTVYTWAGASPADAPD